MKLLTELKVNLIVSSRDDFGLCLLKLVVLRECDHQTHSSPCILGVPFTCLVTCGTQLYDTFIVAEF